jgi:hypothetical protein
VSRCTLNSVKRVVRTPRKILIDKHAEIRTHARRRDARDSRYACQSGTVGGLGSISTPAARGGTHFYHGALYARPIAAAIRRQTELPTFSNQSLSSSLRSLP